MRLILTLVLLLACCAPPLVATEFYGITDPFMAEYEGFWTAKNGTKGRLTAQIRPLSNNRYDGFVLFNRGNAPVTILKLDSATAESNSIKFTGSPVAESGGDLLAQTKISCELRDGKLTGIFSGDLGEGSIDAPRSERKSPTMGAKPPKHALILSDDNATNLWQSFPWTVRNGVLQVGKGNILAKDKLTNYRLHIEFRTPYMPADSGQARGNSGVYLQGKYEVQVLDSFGLFPLKDNDCGGVYRVQAPRVNACLPPMQWQTYDITFVEGTAARPPRITVQQNGVTVVDRAEVPAALVASGTGGGNVESGFLMLQDHGNPVQFRNIWAEPFFSEEKTR